MFYDCGLRFECQRCRYCCGVEPGFVFLTKDDVERASGELGLTEDEFLDQYCRKIDNGDHFLVSLKEQKNYDCVFLAPYGCRIYKARPVQCSTYPFWPEVMKSERFWKEEASYCPGVGKGPLVPKEEIESRLEARKGQVLMRIPKERGRLKLF